MSTPVTYTAVGRNLSGPFGVAENNRAPVSPVEGLGEETGGRTEPASVGIILGCGAGNCAVNLALLAFVFLWEVVWYNCVLLHLNSR